MEWAEMVNSGKKKPGERHQPLVLQEVQLISGEVDALEGGWSSVSAVRVGRTTRGPGRYLRGDVLLNFLLHII